MGRLDRALEAVLGAASLLVLPVSFLLFLQWPLREVAQWMHEYERFWNQRLDRFERYFKDKKRKTEKGK